MSWTQGVQPREDLPSAFLRFADSRGLGPVEYITWDATRPDVVFLDYGERGSLRLTLKKEKK